MFITIKVLALTNKTCLPLNDDIEYKLREQGLTHVNYPALIHSYKDTSSQ